MTGEPKAGNPDMADELEPCPFCGGKAEFERVGSAQASTIVTCQDCGCTLETGEVWSAGTRWNTRARISRPSITADAVAPVFAFAWSLFDNGALNERRLTFTRNDPFEIAVNGGDGRFVSVAVPLYTEWREPIPHPAPGAGDTEPGIAFLNETARYFENRPTGGEDRAHWANVYNAENCRKIASLVSSLRAERDWSNAERNRISDLCDATEHERAIAESSLAAEKQRVAELSAVRDEAAVALTNLQFAYTASEGALTATHHHLKSGHDVTVVAQGKAQVSRVPISDMSRVTIYTHNGSWWVRATAEFNDGRFAETGEPK